MATRSARRSCLSVPGSSAPMIEKALASPADEVVIDLEDAVAPDAKDHARTTVVDVLSRLDDRSQRVSVRVNAAGTPWSHEDIAAVGALPHGVDSIVLPKVESAGDLAYADRLLRGVGQRRARTPVLIQALIESAAGLHNLGEIAGSGGRLDALILGYADLAASLGRAPEYDAWGPARERVLWAARSHGLTAIDGPWLGVADDAAFRESVEQARTTGFDGKWVIHPRQIHAVNAAFSPTQGQIAWAGRVLAALEQAGHAGIGAVQLDGSMLDEAVAVRARQLLAAAEVSA